MKRKKKPVLTDAVIDAFLRDAGRTVKEVEDSLRSTASIPASLYGVRIR